jgi:hypothetical protein
MHWTVAGAIAALRGREVCSQRETVCPAPHNQTRAAKPGNPQTTLLTHKIDPHPRLHACLDGGRFILDDGYDLDMIIASKQGPVRAGEQ